jgi:phytoene dehydrogenase-like protein
MLDVLIIGSGINGLSAAAILSAKGKKVMVLEAANAFGGAIRTEEVTVPGFHHDLFATNLSLFAGGGVMAALKDQLIQHGLEFVPSGKPYCSVFPDGKMIGVVMDRDQTISNIKKVAPEDVAAWQALTVKLGQLAPHLFPLLGTELPSIAAVKILIKAWRVLGVSQLLELIRMLLQSSRAFTDEHFNSPEMKALAATWGMHLDYGPDISGGALFSFLESIGGQEFGMVLGKGGAKVLVGALCGVIESNGGELRSDTNVVEILVEDGKAIGVRTSSGEIIKARSVVANVNPALMPTLLPGVIDSQVSPEVQKLKKFRPGLGTMMIHLAMDELPNWINEQAREFNYVHIAPYVDEMALTYAHAAAGKLPANPTLVIGQPTVSDPSRAPEGKHILWIQVRVLPLEISGDSAGIIQGTSWDEIAEAYADRIIENLETYAPGIKSHILARKTLSPTDLERYNPNLIKGDSLGGSHHPAQFFFLRPMPGWIRHRTPIKNLYLCGSGTWPGGGVGGGSGLMVAKLLS